MKTDLPQPHPWKAPMQTQGWSMQGGVLTVEPSVPSVNAAAPVRFDLLVDYESEKPHVTEWQCSVQTLAATVLPNGFPDPNLSFASYSGAIGSPIQCFSAFNGGTVVAKIECGSGPNARTFYADVRTGRFCLGVQSRVRISVARWGLAAANNERLSIQSSVAPNPASDADPPTYSYSVVLQTSAGPDYYTFSTIPPGALWFDAFGSRSGNRFQVGMGGTFFIKDASSGLVFPPATPWPVPPNSTEVEIVNEILNDNTVTLVFWVR